MKRRITAIHFSSIALIGAVASYSGLAHADEAADQNLRGQTALKAGRILEACQAFEASVKLKPQAETKLNLAACFEQEGKLLSAANLYKDLADSDSNAARRKSSAAKAIALDARVPKLRFAISPKPEGIVIKVDGVTVPSEGDVKIDLGTHEVVATAPGFEGRATASVDREGKAVDVVLRMKPVVTEPVATPIESKPDDGAKTPPDAPETNDGATTALTTKPDAILPARASSSRRTYGVILGAAGLGLLAGSGAMLGIAAGKFSDESDLCPNATCPNPTALARANALLSNGTAYRNIGIGVGIGGAALLVTGAYMFFTGAKEAPPVTVELNGQSTGLVYAGHF